MKRGLLLILVASVALADPPVDAPTSSFAAPLCLDEQQQVALARTVVDLRTTNAALEQNLLTRVPLWVPIVIGVLAAGAGIGVGVAVAKTTK